MNWYCEHNPSNFWYDSHEYITPKKEYNFNYSYRSTFSVNCDFKPLANAMKHESNVSLWRAGINGLFNLGAAALLSRGNGGGNYLASLGNNSIGNLLNGGGGSSGGYYAGVPGSLSSAPYTSFNPWHFVPGAGGDTTVTGNGDDDKTKKAGDGDDDKTKKAGDGDDDKTKKAGDGDDGKAKKAGDGDDGKAKKAGDGDGGKAKTPGDGKVTDSDLYFAAKQLKDANNNGIVDDADTSSLFKGVATGVNSHKATSNNNAAKIGAGDMTEAQFNSLTSEQKSALEKLGIKTFSDLTGKTEVDNKNYPNTISFVADSSVTTDGPGGSKAQSGGRWTFVFTGDVEDGVPQYKYSEALSTVGSYKKAGTEPVYGVTVKDGVIQFQNKREAPAVHFGG